MGRDLLLPSEGINRPFVSIHAPAWGATFIRDSSTPSISFNPRARMGRDLKRYLLVRLIESVSIHAPAWGATASLINAYILGSFAILYAKVIKNLG